MTISLSSRVQPKSYTSNLSPLFYAVIEHTQYQARVKLTGSFRLSAARGHLHPHCIFTELLPETVPQSLRHSCTSELTRQGISLFYSSRRTLSSSSTKWSDVGRSWRRLLFKLFTSLVSARSVKFLSNKDTALFTASLKIVLI